MADPRKAPRSHSKRPLGAGTRGLLQSELVVVAHRLTQPWRTKNEIAHLKGRQTFIKKELRRPGIHG